MQFYTKDGSSDVLDGMMAAAKRVTHATPKLAELKVTFHFGETYLILSSRCHSSVCNGACL